MIEILSTGAQTTIQDLGRAGTLQWGVGTSGAMDNLALACGNLLVGNDEVAAGIEIQVFPFKVCFTGDCTFAVTGADCNAQLDGRDLPPWWVQTAAAGQILELGLPALGLLRACRAYLCVAGGVDVPAVLGSRATQLRGAFGGLDGRPLRDGDLIATCANPHRPVGTGFGLVPPALDMPLTIDGTFAVRVLPAAEYQEYTDASRAAFWETEWRITPQSDRYGYRLEGTPLVPKAPLELRSHGIVPGVIQVPHGGQPIVQMRDAQPSGGYPKIGTVIEADLWRLGQAPIGSRMRFIETTWEAAVAALVQNDRWLAEARRLIELNRLRTRSN